MKEKNNKPKVDLHIHLTGAYPLDYLREISTRKNIQKLEETLKEISSGKIDYVSIFNVFREVEKIVDNESKVFKGVDYLAKELAEMNVIYFEVRTGLRNLGKGKRAYLESILSALEASKRKYKAEINLLLGLKRDSTNSDIIETLKIAQEYQRYGIVGIDISGKEKEGDLVRITKLINYSRNTLPITMHIGEIKKGVCLRDLKLISPSRVSHAVYISEDIKDFLKRKKTPIEICISSNKHTRIINKISNHPFIEYYKQGLEICICSDDPLIFQTNTDKQYEIFRKHLNLSEEDLILLTKNAIRYSFASEQLKNKLLKSIEEND